MSLRRKLLAFLHNRKKTVEYTELEYLESTGTQWIDTGLEFQPIKAVIRLCFNEEQATRQAMGFSSNNTTYFAKTSGGVFELGGGVTMNDSNAYQWQEVVFEHNGVAGIYNMSIGKITVGDKSISRIGTPNRPVTNFHLFNIGNYGTTLACHCKISSAKFYNANDELIADLIPVLDKDLIPCMYDKVSGRFFYNQGTGSFKGYFADGSQLVSYLESTGVEYIDSGIECTSDLKVEFKGACLTTVNSACCGGIDFTNNPVYFRYHWSPDGDNVFFWCQYSSKNTASIFANYKQGEKQDIVVDAPKGEATVNGETINFEALPDGLTTGRNFGIFGRIANTGAIQSRPCKFWYFKIYKKNELVRHLLPVLDSSGTPCMYDLVSKTYLYNQGTGSFSYGE